MKKLLLISLIFFSQFLLAQDPFFLNYSTNEGFPTTTVYSAQQDEKGYLWFTTDVGAVKYDSHSFTVLNTDNGLTDNEVFQMKTDFKGRKWFLTLNGKPSFIFKNKIYNYENSSLIKKVSGTSLLLDFYQDKDLNIYFIFQDRRVAVVKPNNDVEILKINSRNCGVWKFQNTLFFLTNNGVLNSATGLFVAPFNKSSFYKIFHTSFGDFLTDTNILFKINRSNGIDKIATLPNKLEILNIYVENKTKLWVCTRNGLYLIENNVLKKNYFKDYTITGIVKDFEDGYWISTLKNGLLYVPSFDVFIKNLDGINQSKLKCISINDKKEIWIGADNNNYYVKKPNSPFVKNTILESKRVDLIPNIRFFNNETYVIGKLAVYKIDSNGNKSHCHFAANDILIHKNNFFIGYTTISKFKANDVSKFNPKDINKKMILNKRANVLLADNDNTWLGTNFGLYQFNDKDSVTYLGKENEKLQTSIEDLYLDNENKILFAASNSKGIILLKNKKVITHFSTANGLNNNSCNSIKKIGSNNYLIGSNNGLNSIKIKNNSYSVRNLNSLFGLSNKKINDIEFLNDTIYLATDNGLLYFNNKNIESKKSSPKCLIENLKCANKIVEDKAKYKFPYDDNDISIEFKGISYLNQGDLSYYYKLDGKNISWSPTKETQINYKSLSAGNYSFLVYCVNDSGEKSNIQKITFEILKPFWQKPWFLILSFILLSGIMYLFIKYLLKIQQKNFEKEKKAIQIERDKANLEKQMIELEQKALRLQMNPHFIFNALNTIKGYYSEGDAINASSYISKFSKLLRMLLENTEQLIPLSKEIEMLEIYINLTKIRYKNKFEYKLIVDDTLNTNEIAIPTLLLQPMVENAIIHGLAPKEDKGILTVSFLQKNDHLECSVEDDGIGRVASKKIQKNKEYESKALEITHERLALLNNNVGKSSIEINDLETNSIPSGTKVVITIQLISIW